MRALCLFILASLALPALQVLGAEAKPQAESVVLIIFPFASPGDDGKYGRQFAENMRLRGQRLGFVTVDWLSLKDAMGGEAMPALDTKPADVARALKDRLGATLGLWGEVRPEGDGVVIDARGLDLRRDAEKLTISKTYRAAEKQLVNPVEDQVLLELSGKAKKPVAEAHPEEDAKVPTTGPELVKNGDFELGDKSPDGWQKIDGLTTFWVAGQSPTGKCLKIDTDIYETQWNNWKKKQKEGTPAEMAPEKIQPTGNRYDTVGGNYGVAYFSDPIPVKPGKSYKISIGYRGLTADIFFPKIFIRGWADFKGEKRSVYDAYLALRCQTHGKEWEQNVRLIRIPEDTKAPVEFVRLMIYAYWPPGTYYFDNVSMKEAAPTEIAKPSP